VKTVAAKQRRANKVARPDTVAKKLTALFPRIEGIKVVENEFGHKYIHLGNAAEGGEVAGRKLNKEEAEILEEEYLIMPAADYYHEAGYMIHPKLEKAVKDLGWMIEWYDPGTLGAYPQ